MPTKICTVKAMVFPAVTYSCESWTVKKAECWRVNAFELWCWKRLLALKSLLNCKEIKPVNLKGNQPWIFIRRTAAEAEASNTRWEELTHWKRPWFWERLKAEEGDDRGWDGWMASLNRWTWAWASSWSWWWTVLQSMELQRIGCNWATGLNWTESTYIFPFHQIYLFKNWVASSLNYLKSFKKMR